MRMVMMVVLAVAAAVTSVAGEKLVADGQTVVFLGDSITNYGANNPYGYVRLVVKGLGANGIVPKWFGAGIPGNKALHMNTRFDKDVLARKPDLVTISAGVNDVWFARPDCTLEKYRVDMEQMIERGKAAGVKVVLLTPRDQRHGQGPRGLRRAAVPRRNGGAERLLGQDAGEPQARISGRDDGVV